MNTYLDGKGRFRSHVTAFKDNRRELVRLEDRSEAAQARSGEAEGDTLEYTRIWMGVTGPKGAAPPYACVVGEQFDGEWTRKERRPLVLLDEAISLHETLYPDLVDFFQGIVALKDIYRSPAENIDFRIFYVTNSVTPDKLKRDPFYEQLHRLHALSWYDDVENHELKEKYPFFIHNKCTAGVLPSPFEADVDRFEYKMESLSAHDQLTVRPDCQIWLNGAYDTPKLAVAAVALALEAYPWWEDINDTVTDGRGYASASDVEDAERQLTPQERAERRKREAILESVGGRSRRPRSKKQEQQRPRRGRSML